MILLLVLGIVIVVVGILRSVQQHTVRWMPLISGTVLAIAMAAGLYTAHHSNFLLTKVPLDKTQRLSQQQPCWTSSLLRLKRVAMVKTVIPTRLVISHTKR